jgi:hypothetical protein
MTWHSLFSLATMESRHLLFAYAAVFLIQGGYVAWVLWNWVNTKIPR